jgi:hypothetical protein
VTLNAEVWTKTTFSLAVRDRAKETNGYGQDVRTWMLLTSDLRGFIERPDFYFERNDASHRRAADLLMMVQGWRRYDMNMMSGQKVFTKKQPYEDGLYVDGTIFPRTKGDLMENITLSVALYNKHGNVMQGETETYKGGIYDARLPDCYGEWTLLMNASRGTEPVSCYMGINRHFSPVCRGLSHAELQMLPVEDADVLFDDSTEVNDSVVPMDKKNHLLKGVSVKGHRVYDNARSAWENERRGASSATLYYDCAKAADGVADKGERMPEFLDWLADRNSFFSGTSITNPDEIVDYPRRYRLQKEMQRNRNLAKSSIEKNRIEMMDNNGDEISLVSSNGKVCVEDLEKVDENNVNLISRVFDTGYKYKNRPVIWIMNNKFACITGYEGKFKIDDIMGDVDYCLDDLPTTLDEAKSVYISEDENVWQHYISDNILTKAHPITVFVYTFHEFAKDMRGLRRTYFEGFAKPETFKMNDYSQMPPEADYRRTLYWNPNVTTDSDGKAKVEFYNNSSCRQMIISAEGITAEGFPIVYRKQ